MTIELDILQSLGLAIFALILGNFLKDRFNFLRTFFIPSPVIGGLIISILVLILEKSGNFNRYSSNFNWNSFI